MLNAVELFQPQRSKELRQRFGRALVNEFDMESLNLGLQVPPCYLPQHVFDFDEGIRLIVYRMKSECTRRLETYVMANIWYTGADCVIDKIGYRAKQLDQAIRKCYAKLDHQRLSRAEWLSCGPWYVVEAK